jgi:hypothetical protein
VGRHRAGVRWSRERSPLGGEAPVKPKSTVSIPFSLFANNRSPGIPARPPFTNTNPPRIAHIPVAQPLRRLITTQQTAASASSPSWCSITVAWASARVVHCVQAPPTGEPLAEADGRPCAKPFFASCLIVIHTTFTVNCDHRLPTPVCDLSTPAPEHIFHTTFNQSSSETESYVQERSVSEVVARRDSYLPACSLAPALQGTQVTRCFRTSSALAFFCLLKEGVS